MTSIKILNRDLPLRLEWLRSFLAVVDKGGFSVAARELHLSQPAVWTHVRELEVNLGVRLLERVGGRARATRSGEAAAREARRLLDGVRAFRDAVAETEGTVQGVLNLGASTTPANYILPGVMREFERRHPRAKTTLSIGNSARILEKLKASELDVAVVGIEPDGDEFAAQAIRRDEIVLFASRRHPLARKARVSIDALSRERLIVREVGSATRRVMDRVLAAAHVHPTLMELGNPETVKRAVSAELGVGVLSLLAIADDLRRRTFVRLRVQGFPIRRLLYAVSLKRRHPNSTVTKFLQLLQTTRGAKAIGGPRRPHDPAASR